MQISKNYVLRTIAGDNLLVPLGGSSTETKGMILNNGKEGTALRRKGKKGFCNG